ncbi:MAG: lipoprotein insertase outer membrane protein LolB [Proteobacteria bacterium]|nr:lipoprotein insertase outer membrane protein LolB [Pseudomonadota bacterium]
MSRHIVIAVLALVLLSACAGRPLRPDLTQAQVAAAEAAQRAREQALRTDAAWSLTGRVAVSNQGRGGSGRIEWSQAGPRYRVALSAPVTRQGWQLSGDAAGAVLEGIEGGPRRGADARLLLLEATGWDIPVQALSEWVRGARAEALGPARIQYGAGGLPWRIEQGGWRIEFEWPQRDGGAPADETLRPTRLDAIRGEARVKLIIDQWGGA